MAFLLAKYNTATEIRFPLLKAGSMDFAASGDWTPATGDTKVSKDGGSYANSTNNPSAVGGTGSIGWKLSLTATELQCAELNIQIVDSPTKAIEDQFLTVYTYGHSSAKIPIDLSDTVRAGLTALPNAAAEAAGGLATLSAAQSSNGTIPANVHRWLTGTPNSLVSGRVDASVGAVANNAITSSAIADDAITSGKIANGALTAAKFAAGAFDAVWSVATRILTAGTNIVLAKGTGITGLNDLDASEVEAAAAAAITAAEPVDANVTQWRGSTPGNLDANGFAPANVAAVNGNTTRASELASWLDNELLETVPDATAQAVLRRDVSDDQDDAPVTSLAGLVLKGVSRIEFDDTGDTLTVYKTDGTTAFFVQATQQGAIQPITELGVAEAPE
jgi:hypothetical protein